MEILNCPFIFARKTTSDFFWIWKGQMPSYNVKRHWKSIGYRIFFGRYKYCIEVIQVQNSAVRYSNYKIRPGMAKVSLKTNTWTLNKAEMREYCDNRSQEKCRGATWLLVHIWSIFSWAPAPEGTGIGRVYLSTAESEMAIERLWELRKQYWRDTHDTRQFRTYKFAAHALSVIWGGLAAGVTAHLAGKVE